VQDQVQQQQQHLEPDWEARRQEKSWNEAARFFVLHKNALYFGLAFLPLSG
jgi:hypothetical protein